MNAGISSGNGQQPRPPVLTARVEGGRLPVLARLLILGGLALFSLIPLMLIQGVLAERRGRRDEAVAGIARTWGGEQQVFGPMLVLPYRRTVTVAKEEVVDGVPRRRLAEEARTFRATFLPATLAVTGRIRPERRYRGIHEAVVYEAALRLEGHFRPPDFSAWKVAADDVLWPEAELVLGVTDLRGTRRLVSFDWEDRKLTALPAVGVPVTGTGLRVPLAGGEGGGGAGGPWHFAAELTLNGSRSLLFAPVGTSNRVELASSWPDPSFHGGYLPAEREVGADGFRAEWLVSWYGRRFPAQWSTEEGGGAEWPAAARQEENFFGVSLLSLVDAYRVVERAIKHGLLIVVLTFGVFFAMERLTGVQVHPVQYAFTAVALCLFYLAFLSLSEFWPAGRAYFAGAALCTVMIVLYTRPALAAARRSLALALGLAALYGFLYLVLVAQDYSLLIGTGGLFAVLALVMYATRRVGGPPAGTCAR
jgi:inner membrane protein